MVATSLEASADGIDQNPFPGSSGCDFLPQYRIWTREDSLPPCGAASEGESVIPPLVRHPMISAFTIKIPKDTSFQTN